MASYLYRTATTIYPCCIPTLGDLTGAGRERLTRRKSIKLFDNSHNFDKNNSKAKLKITTTIKIIFSNDLSSISSHVSTCTPKRHLHLLLCQILLGCIPCMNISFFNCSCHQLWKLIRCTGKRWDAHISKDLCMLGIVPRRTIIRQCQ